MDKLQILREKKGFIAALDQSGGSTAKTLRRYGVSEESYQNDAEMFDLIHSMRSRIIKSKSFTGEKILGVILFEETMNRMIDHQPTSLYLWEQKNIFSFLKIDKGLMENDHGVQLMKEIPDLSHTLKKAKSLGIIGTKMRSVIYQNNREMIQKVVKQQFLYAKEVASHGLIPIIEPEVDIHSIEKESCEISLKEFIKKELENVTYPVMFKFSIPTIDNFYQDLMSYPQVVRIVALSGGYSKKEACEKLSHNQGMIASFSRALLEGLHTNDTEEEFDLKLEKSIDEIYHASVH